MIYVLAGCYLGPLTHTACDIECKHNGISLIADDSLFSVHLWIQSLIES